MAAILCEESMLTRVGVPTGRIQAEGEEACQAPHLSLFRQRHNTPERFVVNAIVICYHLHQQLSSPFLDFSADFSIPPEGALTFPFPPSPPTLSTRSAQQPTSVLVPQEVGQEKLHTNVNPTQSTKTQVETFPSLPCICVSPYVVVIPAIRD